MKTAEEILMKHVDCTTVNYNWPLIIEAMHEYAEQFRSDVDDKNGVPSACINCGHQNSENCNTCTVINPQFDGV